MLPNLLPIGSVVLLKESSKKIMIMGVCQKSLQNQERIWDYVGVPYPEGFISANKMLMFNNEQIDKIYALGYQDAEQLSFTTKAETLIKELREK